MIWNDTSWRDEHKKLGFNYSTEIECIWRAGNVETSRTIEWNDSEALAIELARDLDSTQGGISVSGSIAFMCLQVNKTTGEAINLYFGRNEGSPLKLDALEGIYMCVSSEGTDENELRDRLEEIEDEMRQLDETYQHNMNIHA